MKEPQLLEKFFRQLFRRGGHGVHSPFVFNLLTRVVEERALYAAYQEILGLPSDTFISKMKIKEREALLLYRIMVHYPISQVLYKGEFLPFLRLLSLKPTIVEGGEEHHAYGPYSKEEIFRLIIVDEEKDLPSPKGLWQEPTIFYLSTSKRKYAKEWCRHFYELMPYGVEVDLLYSKLWIITPNLFKQRYKSIV